MWFGTADGLNRYDGYDFDVFKHNARDITSIANNYITGIVEDDAGNIWVTTWGNGLDMYDRTHNKFVHFIHHSLKKNSVTTNFFTSVVKDHGGNLWVGTSENGIEKFNTLTKEFEEVCKILQSAGKNENFTKGWKKQKNRFGKL